ncbi:MAG: hypothetical protein ISS29_01790 [Candidatus Marinimicrobia bacterium]|nr:hypothetical protein [Candidatus Neomarinimicrobiota bacterium]
MVKKKNNKNNSPQWLKEHWEKSKNQELITVSIYDYDFQRYEDENILSESVKAGINNYNGSEDERNFLEKVYYYDDFGTKNVFPYLIQEMQKYKVEDRHQRTSRFFNILTDLKTIELLNRFFLDIGKPKLIPNEITTIIDQIPDDLSEIKQTLIKSLSSSEKQIEWKIRSLNEDDFRKSILTQIDSLPQIRKKYQLIKEQYENAPESKSPFEGIGNPEIYKKSKNYLKDQLIKLKMEYNRQIFVLNDMKEEIDIRGYSIYVDQSIINTPIDHINRVKDLFEDRKPLKSDQAGEVAHVEARTGPETGAVNTWNDIVIEIIDNETLSIKTGENKASRVNCSEIGFMNKTTSRPNLQWRMLESLAKYKGLIPYREWNFRERKQIEKQISELRKILKSHFKIDSDPIPFKKNVGYKTVFILRDKRPGSDTQ